MKSSAPTSTVFCLSAEACFFCQSPVPDLYGQLEEMYLIDSNRLPI
jgi:hypothetical protein